MENILNDSDESRSTAFTQSSVDLRLIMSYSCVITGGVGRIALRRLCSVSKLRAFRHSLGRLVFFASLRRSPREAGAIFCAAFCII